MLAAKKRCTNHDRTDYPVEASVRLLQSMLNTKNIILNKIFSLELIFMFFQLILRELKTVSQHLRYYNIFQFNFIAYWNIIISFLWNIRFNFPRFGYFIPINIFQYEIPLLIEPKSINIIVGSY